MRIGFDLTPLCASPSGVGAYAANLFHCLAGDGRDELVPLAHRQPWDGSITPCTRGSWPNKSLWMQAVLPWQLARLGVDVCHFTNNVAPVWTPCPSVLTIHDMTIWLFPDLHPLRRLASMRPIIPLAARHAAAVITVSESAKHDIVAILGIPPEKVQVIYEAPGPLFRVLPGGSELEATRRHYGLPERFVLYVGTIEPRKNLVRLLEAFARLRRAGATDWSLVLVGQRGWGDRAVFAAVERLALGSAVRFLGYVPTESLATIYNLADVLAFPSLYEGFGLPVVEAMSCGTPVVTSARGSLGEIAGQAAEYVVPTEVESIADGLHRVLADRTRRAELRTLGLARAAQFSWAEAARQTRQVYEQARDRACETA